LADRTVLNSGAILAVTAQDLTRMSPVDLKYNRLKLTKERIQGISADIRIATKSQPTLGKILGERTLENGLELKKISVPLGVIGIIYEARPNVTFDVFSLCLKSGNALVLKGGSDAKDSNEAIVKIIHEVLRNNGVDENIV